MLLKKLEIERARWGENEGKHRGKITFDGDAGEVTLNLTPELCNKIFEICADGLIETAKEAASNLTCNIIECRAAIGHDG
jgi:hypothetical protein